MKNIFIFFSLFACLPTSLFGAEKNTSDKESIITKTLSTQTITTQKKFEYWRAQKRELELLRDTVKRLQKEKSIAEKKFENINTTLRNKEAFWNLNIQQIVFALKTLSTTIENQEEYKKTTITLLEFLSKQVEK